MAYKDPEKDKAWHRQYRKKVQTKLRELSRSLKNVPCADCGLTFHPVCMDWDHISLEVKTCNVAQTYSRGMKAFLAEMEKCEVVCANCHRLRTFYRKQYRASVYAEKPDGPTSLGQNDS